MTILRWFLSLFKRKPHNSIDSYDEYFYKVSDIIVIEGGGRFGVIIRDDVGHLGVVRCHTIKEAEHMSSLLKGQR